LSVGSVFLKVAIEFHDCCAFLEGIDLSFAQPERHVYPRRMLRMLRIPRWPVGAPDWRRKALRIAERLYDQFARIV
jgi:hypothetical protein